MYPWLDFPIYRGDLFFAPKIVLSNPAIWINVAYEPLRAHNASIILKISLLYLDI